MRWTGTNRNAAKRLLVVGRYNPSYTNGMKTAVSLPDDLFALAEITAKRLHISRSRLYARAISEFVNRVQSDNVTEQLNRVYGTAPAVLDPALQNAQLLSIDEESW